MEKAKKRIRFCLLFVVVIAVAVGIVYYYGQMMEKSDMNEGTLISNLETEIKQLCR